MVKLVSRPYLIALLGLTVCISLWQIAVVQWDASAAESQRSDHGRSRLPADPRNASLGPDRRDKAANRGILSSAHLGGQLEAGDEVSTRRGESSDYKSLIDLENEFEFRINQPPCPTTGELLVMVLVHSAPKNFRKRLAIRQTWARHPDPAMRVLFLLGGVSSPALQFKLELENERFGDLVQGSFLDSYRNMTYKHAMALKWFSYHCAGAPLLLKTDDDVFVNSPALMEYVHENVNGVRDRPGLINCKVVLRAPVKRSYRSKWRVSMREYRNAVYPDYCPGFIVLYSADMALRLYRAAQLTRYFWIDDVHVTGTLRELVNGTLLPFRDTYFKKAERRRLREPYVRNMPLFSEPDLTESEIRGMWALVSKTREPRPGFREDAEAVEMLAQGLLAGPVSGAEQNRPAAAVAAALLVVVVTATIIRRWGDVTWTGRTT